MKRQIFLYTFFILIIGPASQAHEGHDHEGPISIPAPKGGIIKSLEGTSVEVVSRGKEIKMYLYDKETKPQSTSGFLVAAKVELPRTKKQEAITLTAKDTFYEATYDAKGLHRYTLLISIKDLKTGHDDKLSFTIEPKK